MLEPITALEASRTGPSQQTTLPGTPPAPLRALQQGRKKTLCQRFAHDIQAEINRLVRAGTACKLDCEDIENTLRRSALQLAARGRAAPGHRYLRRLWTPPRLPPRGQAHMACRHTKMSETVLGPLTLSRSTDTNLLLPSGVRSGNSSRPCRRACLTTGRGSLWRG